MTEGENTQQAWVGSPVCESTADEKEIKKAKTVQESVDLILSVFGEIKANNYAMPHEGCYEDTVDIAYETMNFPKGHRNKCDTWQEAVPYGTKLSGWQVFKRKLLPVTLILSALVSSWVIPVALSSDDQISKLDVFELPITTTLHKQGTTFIVFLATMRLITGGWMILFERLIMRSKHHDMLENLMLAVFVPGLFEMLLNLNTLKHLPGGMDAASGGLKCAAVIIPVLHMSLVPLHATWNMCTGWMLILTLAGPKALKNAWRKFPGDEGFQVNKEEDAAPVGFIEKGKLAAQAHVQAGVQAITAAV